MHACLHYHTLSYLLSCVCHEKYHSMCLICCLQCLCSNLYIYEYKDINICTCIICWNICAFLVPSPHYEPNDCKHAEFHNDTSDCFPSVSPLSAGRSERQWLQPPWGAADGSTNAHGDGRMIQKKWFLAQGFMMFNHGPKIHSMLIVSCTNQWVRYSLFRHCGIPNQVPVIKNVKMLITINTRSVFTR